MKISELDQAFVSVFGPHRGPSIRTDLVLSSLGSRTAAEAVEDGEPPQRIWHAVCDEMDLAEPQRFPHRQVPGLSP